MIGDPDLVLKIICIFPPLAAAYLILAWMFYVPPEVRSRGARGASGVVIVSYVKSSDEIIDMIIDANHRFYRGELIGEDEAYDRVMADLGHALSDAIIREARDHANPSHR